MDHHLPAGVVAGAHERHQLVDLEVGRAVAAHPAEVVGAQVGGAPLGGAVDHQLPGVGADHGVAAAGHDAGVAPEGGAVHARLRQRQARRQLLRGVHLLQECDLAGALELTGQGFAHRRHAARRRLAHDRPQRRRQLVGGLLRQVAEDGHHPVELADDAGQLAVAPVEATARGIGGVRRDADAVEHRRADVGEVHRGVGDDDRHLGADLVEDGGVERRFTRVPAGVEQLAAHPGAGRGGGHGGADAVDHGVEGGVGLGRAVEPAVEHTGRPQVHVRFDQAGNHGAVAGVEHLGVGGAQVGEIGHRAGGEDTAVAHGHGLGRRRARDAGGDGAEHQQVSAVCARPPVVRARRVAMGRGGRRRTLQPLGVDSSGDGPGGEAIDERAGERAAIAPAARPHG
ncbi:MAG: hypothetical protein R2690_07340 [Acidimicrobiales bacterium]